MKFLFPVLTLSVLAFTSALRAEDKNGYRITVQKTTLERDDTRGPGYYDDHIDRALGLKVSIKNIAMKEKGEATIEYSIIVSRWGYTPTRYEKYTGTEKVIALKQQESTDLTLGKARIGGYANYANKRYQDKVEAWQIVLKDAAGEAATVQSGATYEKMAAKAKPPRITE